MRKRHIAVLVVFLVAAFSALAASKATPESILRKIGVTRGVCVVLGDDNGSLALDLARRSDLTILVQLPAHADMQSAGKALHAAGVFGTRVFLATTTNGRISLADDVADAVVAVGDAGVAKNEVLRVLRPEGKALVVGEEFSKPFPAGVDDWRHHYHNPDNNPQSLDKLARAPFLTQFVVEPRYGPCPQMAVSSAGRVFMAFGNVAWHQREEPWMDTLVAMNGYNGTILWKRPLSSGIMVDRSTMIATPDALYLADDKSCKVLDAATGELRQEIIAPMELTNGTFWKWMAQQDGVLYALVGQQEPADPQARWRSERHGWPWTGISKGYNENQYTWGFAQTLVAMDPQTKKVLWHHQENPPIDSRAMCMKNGRIYYANFGNYITCLDAKTGKQLWRRTAETDTDVFAGIGPYRPGHGYVGGWKSTVYLKCTDKALYFLGPQVEWLTALSADDGHFLWKHPVKDLHMVIRDDGIYTIGPQRSTNQTSRLDPASGAILASYTVDRRACTRSTGSADGIFFRAPEGTARFDTASGKVQWISSMRPSCQVGVLIANGHLYWLPWTCDCNLQLFGTICLAPAGKFAFDQAATDAERLESLSEIRNPKSEIRNSDWPTYRANNARTAATQAAMPGAVKLLWHFDGKSPTPTAPVAVGGSVFVSGADGIVRALDAANGKPRWTAYTGGAVKFPPTIANGRAFVGAGDGYAYALDAASGAVLWRFRAAPVDRRISFYGSLLSTWPVGSGVLVENGTAYLAAGITDQDGTHVYALDAATGKLKWQNNTCGHLDADSRRGIACEGELLLHDGKLYLAGGNSLSPGIFDLADGKCLNTPPDTLGAKAIRGRELALADGQVKVSGQPLYSIPECPVFDKTCKWEDVVVSAQNAKLSIVEQKGEKQSRWILTAKKSDGAELWSQPLPGEPVRWGIAVDADGRVLVSLRGGSVLCFGK